MNLYISDLDGTLLNSDQIISRNSINIINNLIKNSGLNFTVATARSYESSKRILQPLNLKVPVILNNGAFIYDPIFKKNIVENYLDSESVRFILKTYCLQNISPFVSIIDPYGNRRIFYRDVFNEGQRVYLNSRKVNKDKRLIRVDDFSAVKNCKVINIFAIEKKINLDYEYGLFKEKLNVSCHYTEEIYSKGFFWLETTSTRANKGYAAEYLKKYLNADRLVCFGDNLNDSSLFKTADEKYAVENAYIQLKKLATGVIASNNEDGVAKFLEMNAQ